MRVNYLLIIKFWKTIKTFAKKENGTNIKQYGKFEKRTKKEDDRNL